jgi:hypothetical protein
VHAEPVAQNSFIKPHIPACVFAAADKRAVPDLEHFLRRLFE